MSAAASAAGTKACPDCAETVKAGARKCRFCGYLFGTPVTAVPAAAGAGVVAPGDVLARMTHLADKNLVVCETDDRGEVRYRLLETVRQYARDRLLESGEAETIRRRHGDHFLALAERAEAKLRGAAQRAWLDRLEGEYDNLRAVLEWSCETDDGGAERALRLVGALAKFWQIRGYASEAAWWLEAALAQSEGEGGAGARTPARAKALAEAGARARQENNRQARAWLEESLAIWRELGDRAGIADALNRLAGVVRYGNDPERARGLGEESAALYRALGDEWGLARALNSLGSAARDAGDYEAARAFYEESLARFRDLGDRWRSAVLLSNLGVMAFRQGDHAAAQTWLEASLSICREMDARTMCAWSLGNLGKVAMARRDYRRAASLFEECLELRREQGDEENVAYLLLYLGHVARLSGDDGAARRRYAESLTLYGPANHRWGGAACLIALAGVAARAGRPERAARLLGAVEALRDRREIPLSSTHRAGWDETRSVARDGLGEVRFAAAYAHGRALSLEQAIAYALEDETP